jgi:hypothetical protein
LKRAIIATALLMVLASGAAAGQRLADLMAVAKPVRDVRAFANDYVSVRYAVLEYPAAARAVAEARPVVVYIHVAPKPGLANTQVLDPPKGARPLWRPGVVPLGVNVDLLRPPPPPPDLGAPGTDLPREAVEERAWDGGRLVVATFRPFDYAVGTGGFPSVTTFLSEGVVEVASRGLRRRMGVQAGDAFWFEARTRLTVVDDYPIGAAILQIFPSSRR